MTSVVVSIVDILALGRNSHVDLICISTSRNYSEIGRNLVGSFGTPTDVMQVTECVDVDGIDETEKEKVREREGHRSAFAAFFVVVSSHSDTNLGAMRRY